MILLRLVLYINWYLWAQPPSHFSKHELHHKLISGNKWKQTNLPLEDAKSKLQQAEAANSIHVALFSREVVARTNQMIYGFESTGPLNIIGFGSTGLMAEYNVLNRAFQSRVEAAKANEKMGKETVRQYQNDLSFLLMLRYANTQQLQKKLKLMELSLSKDNDIIRLAKIKVRTGAGIPLDLVRAESLLERDRIKKLEIEVNLKKSIHELSELTGTLPEKTTLDELVFTPITVTRLDQMNPKTNDRPEIKVNDYSLEAVRKLKEQIENERIPEIKIFGEIAGVGTDALGLKASASGVIGIQLQLPLIDGGYHQGKLAEASTKVSYLELQSNQLKDETQNQFKNSISQIELTQQAVTMTQKAVETANLELKYAESKVRIGSAGNLDLINAKTNVTSALDLNVQAIFAHETAKLSFFHLIADISSYLNETKPGAGHE